MPPDLSATDNPGIAPADNPSISGPAGVDVGTSATGGQAPGAAPAEDLFKGVDPNRLPPEVRGHYDQMLRDYREKTGKLSETVKSETAKAVEAFKQKAEFYDQLITQEEFVRQWNEHVQKVSAAESAKQDDPTVKLEKKLQALEAQVMKSSTVETINAFAGAVDEKGQKIYSDFDKLNGIVVSEVQNPDGSRQEISMLGVAIDAAPGKTVQEKLVNGYKTAKKVYDTIFEEGKKAGMGRLQTKAFNGTQPPSSTPPVSGPSRRPKNALEALQFAKAGLPVYQE
jgi:hypothetical protein